MRISCLHRSSACIGMMSLPVTALDWPLCKRSSIVTEEQSGQRQKPVKELPSISVFVLIRRAKTAADTCQSLRGSEGSFVEAYPGLYAWTEAGYINCPDTSQTAARARSQRPLRSALPFRSDSSRSFRAESRLCRREMSQAPPTKRRDP